jgi:hypothetical protein
MGTLSNYLTHFRFTFGEFRTNVPRVGFRNAWHFFLMRLSVPFGRPRRYFMRRTARSPIVNSIDATGFAELPGVTPQTVRQVIEQLLASASAKISTAVASVDEYAEALRRMNVERHTGLICDGTSNCVLAQVARSPVFAHLAAEYLELEPQQDVRLFDGLFRGQRPP